MSKKKKEEENTEDAQVVKGEGTKKPETKRSASKKTGKRSKPKKKPKGEPGCPYCSLELKKIDPYDEFFCENCDQYIHRHLLGIPQKDRVVVICPNCKGEPQYLYEYGRHYCHTCKTYLSEDELKSKRIPLKFKRTPAPPPPEFYLSPPPLMHTESYLCKQCNNELQFIDQYHRWYCYNCGEYI